MKKDSFFHIVGTWLDTVVNGGWDKTIKMTIEPRWAGWRLLYPMNRDR